MHRCRRSPPHRSATKRGPTPVAWAFIGIMDMHIMTKTNLPHAELTHELAEGLVDMYLGGVGADGRCPSTVRCPFQLG